VVAVALFSPSLFYVDFKVGAIQNARRTSYTIESTQHLGLLARLIVSPEPF
jgi:hypothetical protein